MINYLHKGCLVSMMCLLLCSCGEREGLAPVVEVNWRAANTHATQYVVARGDTLYAIAFRYDQDYRQLAAANHLHSPYTVRVGQVIRLRSTNSPVIDSPPPPIKPIAQPQWVRPTPHTVTMVGAYPQSSHWLWPVRGRVIANFAPQQGRKGIDIAGSKGGKIYAANGGVVAYAGSGLSGYGNLIIIKHDNQYLTAYGNNSRNYVREGQRIRAGQAIAEIGVINRQYWGVHFEIRKIGKPVNPLNYLQNG